MREDGSATRRAASLFATDEGGRRPSLLLVASGLLLLAGYALPLYAPPPPAMIPQVLPDTGTWQRLFPGVPAFWVIARLLALLAGSMMVVFGLGSRCIDDANGAARSPREGSSSSQAPRWSGLLLLVAGVLLVAAASQAERFARPGQLAFLLALLATPLAVGATSMVRFPRLRLPSWSAAALLSCAWMALRLPLSWGSPRIADGLDYLDGYVCFASASEPTFNVLTEGCWAGYTAITGVLHGQGILGWQGLPLSLDLVQTIAALWSAIAAVLLAAEVSRHLGRGAGLVAAAVFLWSPLVMLRTLVPPPFTLTTMTVLVATLASRERRVPSPAAAAGFGALLGLASHVPNLVLLVPLAALVCARPLLRRPADGAVALLFFAAAAIPGASAHAHLLKTTSSLAAGSGAWAALEGVYSGRVATSLAEGARTAGITDPMDIALGLLLSPFAVARASIRLWGDTLIEPIGAALAGVGLVVSLVNARRSKLARFALVFAAAALLPGVVSSYDRVHPTRVELVLVASTLAALGWSLLSARFAPRLANVAALLLSVVVAASGTFLFDVVNPRFLAPSAAGLALRAGRGIDREVVWSEGVLALALDYGWVLRHGPVRGEVSIWRPRTLERDFSTFMPRALFWTPGDQMDEQVGKRLCALKPDLNLFEVVDNTGLVRLFAAFANEERAPTEVKDVRWNRLSCEGPFETDATEATRALAKARDLATAGDIDGAIDTLESCARLTLVQPRLYLPLARLLASRATSHGDIEDRHLAMFWADLACRVTQASFFEACMFADGLRRLPPIVSATNANGEG